MGPLLPKSPSRFLGEAFMSARPTMTTTTMPPGTIAGIAITTTRTEPGRASGATTANSAAVIPTGMATLASLVGGLEVLDQAGAKAEAVAGGSGAHQGRLNSVLH